MRESNTKFSVTHISQKRSTFLLPLSSFIPFIVVLGLLLLSTLVPFSHLSIVFKIANRSYYHSAPVLWNNIPYLIYVKLLIKSFLLLYYIRLSLIFHLHFFLKSQKPIFFTFPFLLSLYSPRLSQD